MTKKEIVYRCNDANNKMIVAAVKDVITKNIIEHMHE